MFIWRVYSYVDNIHWVALTMSKKMQRNYSILVGAQIVTELFNIAANDFDVKKSTRYNRVLVVTLVVVSGTYCIPELFNNLQINQ